LSACFVCLRSTICSEQQLCTRFIRLMCLLTFLKQAAHFLCARQFGYPWKCTPTFWLTTCCGLPQKIMSRTQALLFTQATLIF
jgi:hypothetical protein